MYKSVQMAKAMKANWLSDWIIQQLSSVPANQRRNIDIESQNIVNVLGWAEETLASLMTELGTVHGDLEQFFKDLEIELRNSAPYLWKSGALSSFVKEEILPYLHNVIPDMRTVDTEYRQTFERLRAEKEKFARFNPYRSADMKTININELDIVQDVIFQALIGYQTEQYQMPFPSDGIELEAYENGDGTFTIAIDAESVFVYNLKDLENYLTRKLETFDPLEITVEGFKSDDYGFKDYEIIIVI